MTLYSGTITVTLNNGTRDDARLEAAIQLIEDRLQKALAGLPELLAPQLAEDGKTADLEISFY